MPKCFAPLSVPSGWRLPGSRCGVACSEAVLCELVSQPEQMPRVLEIAILTAISRRGVAVLAIPGDIALREAAGESRV